mmetsp:Transcript_31082/g.50724  ORF Transcript_31082/g.50724 Transcript_31082/m.50724 type:complete len:360 (+) Transcript_31082:78-1157(+)
MAQEGTKLFVGGIPTPNATEEQVAELFETHGAQLSEVVILPPKGTNPETRCGFVRVNPAHADHVCTALNGMTFEGFAEKLVVRAANNQAPRAAMPGLGQHVAPPSYGVVVRPPGAGAVVPPLQAVPANGGFQNLALQDLGSGGFGNAASSPTERKEEAKAEGRWLDCAGCVDEEYAASGESFMQKVQRLSEELKQAAMQEHYYEAASLSEALFQLDPQAAANANAMAAAAVSPSIVQTVPPPVRVPARRPVEPPSFLGLAKAAPPAHPPSTLQGGVGQAQEQSRYTGTIISFHPERHFGFIQSPDLGADAFLSDKQVGNFQVGDSVTFEVTYNIQGKPQAQRLEAAGFGMEPMAKRFRS